jgi:hypothetical protein
MATRFATALVSLASLTVAACGSSNETKGTLSGTGGGTTVVPSGNGGGVTVPTGSGGAAVPNNPTGAGGSNTVPPTGSGGAIVAGTGGTTTVAPMGSGGAATPGAGGASTTACDDNALASAKDVCAKGADPCNLHSGYAGDDYCILPPPAGMGIQIHFGPKNYTDMAEVSKYLMQPGEEFNAYGLATIPDVATAHWYNYIQIRMRPGSHHLINELVTGATGPDGFSATPGCQGTVVASFPGTQNLIRNMPPGGIQAPENVGLGSQLQANTKLCVNHHAYNFDGATPKLREIWMNVWFVDEAAVTQKTSAVNITAGPFQGIPPHSQKVLKASATISGTGRIIDLFGHRHAATDRFAVWKNDQLVYDSWKWDESVAFDYNSITTNPAPNPTAKQDGAVSGVLPIVAGDKISIECDVNNTTDNTLTFRNELYTGEMCILFGSSVGTPVR